MRIRYSNKAIDCITEIGNFLKQNNLQPNFISNHLNELKTKIASLLTAFPNSGYELQFKNTKLRRLVVNNYSVLYKYSSEKQLIEIAYIHKQNLPKL